MQNIFTTGFTTGLIASFGLACFAAPAAAEDTSFVQTTMLENAADNRRIAFEFEAPDMRHVRIDGMPWATPILGSESMATAAGEPALPDVRRPVQISDNDTIEVRVVSGSWYDVEDVDIAPSKGPISRDTDPSQVPYTFGSVYDSADFWPAEVATLAEPHVMRNTRGVVLTVNPLQWNPATRTLRVWTDMVVDVASTGTTTHNVLTRSALETHTDNAAWQTMYGRHYINYTGEHRYDPLDNSGDMLIISHDAWIPNVQPLADHKNSIGINTTVVGISTIGNSPASIEAYIDSMYDSGDLCYVLLVGDAQHISAYTAADNGLSDPTYGKMTADNYPDIFVGRFSAESAADVDTQVERTIAYEVDGWTQKPEYMHALGIASNQGPGDDGETDDQHVQNILNQLAASGYTYTQGEYDPSGSIPDAVDALNNMGIGTIAYCGHGSETCFGNGAALCISDVNSLTNTEMLPWIVSVACVNGAYASGTCFAESWLRATDGGEPTGAIAIYASSINQSWSEPMCAEDEIYDLYTDATYTTLGVLYYGGSCQMMDEYGSSGVDMYDTWHIFGDPSLVVVGLAAPPSGMRVGGSGFAAEGPLGGPFLPDACEFVLTNYEDVPINFDVSIEGGSWLNVFPTSGAIPVDGEVIVSAELNGSANSLPNGNHAISLYFTNLDSHDGDTSKDVSVTVGVPVPVREWTFDSDPGWSMEGEWAFGQPTGQGGGDYGNADPTSGATGANVYGVNLNGDYSLDPGGPWALTSEAIDCSTYTDTSVSFQRWLNCDYQSYVIDKFEVSSDGSTWSTLWENPTSGETADSSWNLQEYDISSVADGESTVYLRWTHAVSDWAWAYSGWNIDDVVISAVDSDDSGPCTGDTDGSGDVGADDLLMVIGEFGCTAGCGAADVDGDGAVDTNDILAIVAAWGPCL
ncbi:MAG: C25 family cysteine peptidase [Phycisphaerales bacterium]|nr:C25 family cysteine peptidase [Phycisphaerales bacterium]